MKTNYDKLFDVLIEWYTEEQVHEIWKMLKEYDKNLFHIMEKESRDLNKRFFTFHEKK